MKRLPFFTLLLGLSLMQACNDASKTETATADQPATASTSEDANTGAAVADAVSRLNHAMEDADSAALYALTSPKLTYGHSSGKVEDQQTYISNILNGNSDFVKITITDQQIIMDGATAIVRHQLSATTNDRGQPGEVQLKIMLVWQLQDTGWTLIARQAVK